MTRTLRPFVYLAPTIAIIFLVALYPIYFALDISLHRTRYFQKLSFVGFDNYLQVLTDPRVHSALLATLKFGLGSLILTVPLGLLFAVLLNRDIRFKTTFRAILFIPWALSQAVAGMLWAWVLNPSYGPAKYLFDNVGITDVVFLSDPNWAMGVLVGINTWMSYPLATVLLLAALQTVPKELREAAIIDGCTPWSAFWRIVIPYIRSSVVTTTIILSLQFFNMVTLIYVVTGGGPLGATLTLSLMVFQDGFLSFRVSTAAAVGLAMFLLNIVFSLAYIQVLRRGQTNS
jgi:ABC-type sugar transport system permease subunit